MIKLNNKKLGDYCRKMRIRNGYTCVDVAKVLGYTHSNITKFENGKNNSASILLYYLNMFADEEDIFKVVRRGARFYEPVSKEHVD